MKKILKLLCATSLASMILYAFTGIAIWSQLQLQDAVRGMLLALIHVMPFLIYLFYLINED